MTSQQRRVTVVEHPVVAHRVGALRDARTPSDVFRTLARELSVFVAYEAFRGLETVPIEVITPIGAANARSVTGHLLVVPILRAGLGMVEGVQMVVPHTEVAHLGMRRDETTLDAVTYLDGLPDDLSGKRVAVCDPMLATGGSLAHAVDLVASRRPARIDALCLLASAPGLARFHDAHPDVPVTCVAVDDELDERGYIVPGLGDAGDRLFGPPPS
ncbi:uracil phosphoribosyltransferase [Acidiferrimicrobium sp. IK]|uniref:uracil phosphoribosyltransferase n=1 Tax=Acidiferrimicrobium sp. IK TaxID=2871700 RepID=UPI0021CB49AA|nr:uracil phosphoribosyltransferase [Acidiferrimicrobium sp. IK]MCU4186023.1 uracil phosphoribosyltransferase [Acidiferrimicrobium sp. IK]